MVFSDLNTFYWSQERLEWKDVLMCLLYGSVQIRSGIKFWIVTNSRFIYRGSITFLEALISNLYFLLD